MNIACYIRNDAVFEQVQVSLARAGFACDRFTSESLLLRTVRRRSFDFVVIDIGLEFEENEGIFSWLNCRTDDSTPVLILSPEKAATLVAHVLNAGADDFLLRPFEPVELVARINAVLRRCDRRQVRRTIEVAGFVLDQDASSFSYQGAPIELTPREFTMAWMFFSSPGVYISRETIGTAIWGTDSEIAGRTIEQHVYKLRKKLLLGAERGIVIRTAYSQGYRLELTSVEREPKAA
ncbi:DNA-binding response regulator [Noviherbaspirillum cavernae]|uniref:DNA-binding response regulator n=1 Tax=Noviherbaspirillum cavernae TaxID=2320862 RepID=A0A418WVY4_9BURK|nr:response regulator transcription factor [Noviherbaspirillum cavernae]RJF96850.1 DNA-binding response regulator [Noviherbaspirillum cavernae]